MEMFSFYLENILRPTFEDPKLMREELSDQIEDEDDENENELDSRVETARSDKRIDGEQRSLANSEQTSVVSSKRRRIKRRGPEDILDLQGPKLMVGCRVWILFYQLVGQLNWLGVPFYLSIIYKIALLGFVCYIVQRDFIGALFNTSIVDLTYRNPIFIFISFLAITSTAFNSILAFYTNLFKLCPLFKVLTTPKLCFITEEVQHIIGTKTISCILMFLTYHTCLLLLLVHTDMNEFIRKFQFDRFLVFLFCSICSLYHMIGLSHLDFYIRACFASWLIALKGNLEYRFAHLHRHQRLHRLRQNQGTTRLMSLQEQRDEQSLEVDGDDASSVKTSGRTGSEYSTEITSTNDSHLMQRQQSQKSDTGQQSSLSETRDSTNEQQRHHHRQMTLEEFKEKYKIVTLDEIQKNLNAMDDHLEVWRSIQTSSLVLITLNAFLTNGALLLLAYNLLANKGNYYHGLLLILLATNYTLVIFFCYVGDSWLYYALSSFVQTVEDEYFLQGGDDGAMIRGGNLQRRQGSLPMYGGGIVDKPLDLTQEHQLLLIKKKDVLFCREFLHQFENHLATPWSKLTVKVHLRMVGTFVTLIAAQIIFDHEH